MSPEGTRLPSTVIVPIARCVNNVFQWMFFSRSETYVSETYVDVRPSRRVVLLDRAM